MWQLFTGQYFPSNPYPAKSFYKFNSSEYDRKSEDAEEIVERVGKAFGIDARVCFIFPNVTPSAIFEHIAYLPSGIQMRRLRHGRRE